MKRPSPRLTIAFILILVSLGVVLYVALAASDSGPDLGACKSAMRKQFEHGMTHPDDPAGTRPRACQGVSDRDLQRFATEIMNDYLDNS